MAYLLDSNAFIEAKKRWYGFDFCPAYWDWLDAAHEAGSVFSIERVADEILAGDDALSDWARDRADSFFLRPDGLVLASLSQLSAWVTAGQYDQSAVATFLDVADSYLVAHAHAYGHTVVTHEKVANSRRNVKIPNACAEMDVKYLTPFEMLRIERARFVVGSKI
jgi:predicted nucleic acid-binding protein